MRNLFLRNKDKSGAAGRSYGIPEMFYGISPGRAHRAVRPQRPCPEPVPAAGAAEGADPPFAKAEHCAASHGRAVRMRLLSSADGSLRKPPVPHTPAGGGLRAPHAPTGRRGLPARRGRPASANFRLHTVAVRTGASAGGRTKPRLANAAGKGPDGCRGAAPHRSPIRPKPRGPDDCGVRAVHPCPQDRVGGSRAADSLLARRRGRGRCPLRSG